MQGALSPLQTTLISNLVFRETKKHFLPVFSFFIIPTREGWFLLKLKGLVCPHKSWDILSGTMATASRLSTYHCFKLFIYTLIDISK